MRRSISRGSSNGKVRPVPQHASLPSHPMPSRTIEESHGPRVSDRTMPCHSWSGQSSGLLFQKTMGAVTNTEMEPQGRTIDASFRTRRQSKTLCLEKTTRRVRDYVQAVGLNAATKKGRHRPDGEKLCIDIPFYRTFPIQLMEGLYHSVK